MLIAKAVSAEFADWKAMASKYDTPPNTLLACRIFASKRWDGIGPSGRSPRTNWQGSGRPTPCCANFRKPPTRTRPLYGNGDCKCPYHFELFIPFRLIVTSCSGLWILVKLAKCAIRTWSTKTDLYSSFSGRTSISWGNTCPIFVCSFDHSSIWYWSAFYRYLAMIWVRLSLRCRISFPHAKSTAVASTNLS